VSRCVCVDVCQVCGLGFVVCCVLWGVCGVVCGVLGYEGKKTSVVFSILFLWLARVISI